MLTARNLRTGTFVSIHLTDSRVRMEAATQELAASDVFTGPGWIDIQVNGFAGHDINKGDLDVPGFERMTQALHSKGVAHYLPTIITATERHMAHCLNAVAQAQHNSLLVGCSVSGIHLEGPFLSPEDGARGAHPLAHIRDPDRAIFDALQEAARGQIRLVTLAPERPGALDLTAYLHAQGIVVAIGHSLADDTAIREAVDAGARLSTHLGNGLPRLLPRHPNPLWAQLAEDRLTASVIFDGHHLPESTMKVFYRVKGNGGLIITSDAVALAGCEPGVYEGQVGGTVELHPNGRLTMLGSEYLAGSASSLADGLNVAIHRVGMSVEDAVSCVTSTPARLLGLDPEKSETIFIRGSRLEALCVAIAGEIVYQRKE